VWLSMWRDEVVERSWRVLGELKGFADFVLIGGWGVYLWTRKLKSRVIDVYVDQESFYKLQSELTQKGYALKRNVRLMKFEALIGYVEVDIYTPFVSRLVIPCLDVFVRRFYSVIDGFKVAIPEVLLLLKAQAAQDRWHAEKGLKDRVDIISLLKFADVKQDVLEQLLAEYDTRHVLREAIRKTISESRIEYKFLGLAYEKDGVQLRRSYKNL